MGFSRGKRGKKDKGDSTYDKDLLLLEELLQEDMYEASTSNLFSFYKHFWHTHAPEQLHANWFHECVCEHVQAALNREIRRLIINCPPRTGKSQKADTPVLLADGTVKCIQNIVHGDTVIALDPATGTHHPRKVINHWDNGMEPCYKITLQNGATVTATAEHRFYTWKGYRHVSDLQVGDDISCARFYATQTTFEDQLTPEELRSIALWMAEGHKTPRHTYKVTNYDQLIREQAKKDAELLGFNCDIERNHKNFTFTGKSERFGKCSGEWISSYFDKDKQRCTTYSLYIPRSIFRQTNENLSIFLGMFIATDGWITSNGKTIGIGLASEQCIHDLKILFNRLGITSQIRYKETGYTCKKTNERKRFDSWELTITGADNHKLAKAWFTGKVFHKEELLQNLKTDGLSDKEDIPHYWVEGAYSDDMYNVNRIVKGKRWSNLTNVSKAKSVFPTQEVIQRINSEEHWQKIESIEFVGDQHVFDIEVEEFNNFTLANGIHSHNSSIVSISAPPWHWINTPEEKFWLISHTASLYTQNIVWMRNILDHYTYKNRWCDPKKQEHYSYSLAKDVNTKTRIENTEGGYILGGSPGSGALGMGYSVALLDDILDSREASNPIAINMVNDWYTKTFLNRSNNVNTDVQIIIMQRLATGDLSAYVQKVYGDQNWLVLNLPARYEPERTFFSPIGFNDKRTYRNELLDPVRLPASFLLAQQKDIVIYNTRYQQNPSSAVGNIIHRDFIRTENALPDQPASVSMLIWDLNASEKDTASSFTVGILLSKFGDEYWILDMWRRQCGFLEQLEGIRYMHRKYPNALTGIESRSNGIPAVTALRNEITNIYEFQPKQYGGSKIERLNAVLDYFKSGKVVIYIPNKYDTTRESDYDPATVQNELLEFPTGSTDDIVDDFAYGIQYLSTYGHVNTALISAGKPLTYYETTTGKITLGTNDLNEEILRKGSNVSMIMPDTLVLTNNTRSEILDINW